MQEESKNSYPDPKGDQDMITDVDELTGDVILYPKEMKDVIINQDKKGKGQHANNQGGQDSAKNIMDYESSEDGDAAPTGYQGYSAGNISLHTSYEEVLTDERDD